MSRHRALLVALVLVLAGCSFPALPDGPSVDDGEWTWPDDPPSDRLGWEDGYWYNESLDIDQSDGLDETEREALVARTMARVEHIRRLEFEQRVPVSVVSREQYRANRTTQRDQPPMAQAWNDQVWEALLLIGEDRRASEVLDDLYGGSVVGFYSISRDEIVVVSDSQTPQIDRATLAHELVHALQDQQFGLESNARTRDAQLARNGIVEGDARYVEMLYEERCESGAFECIDLPDRFESAEAERNEGNESSSENDAIEDTEESEPIEPVPPGVFATIYTPYSEGPHLVHTIRQRGGWSAVNDVYAQKPASTEQLIHPDAYPDERPSNVVVTDRSASDWSRLEHTPVAETVGEAAIYAMFWQNHYIDYSSHRRDPSPYSRYDYDDPASAGWGGDTLVPYRSEDDEYGYVWAIEWDSVDDAKEFKSAYETTLTLYLGGQRVESGVYRIPDGNRAFGDAFRVTRNGNRVTVVNAPAVETLDDVHRSRRN